MAGPDDEPEIAPRHSPRVDRLAVLEEEVAELRADLERLREAHHDLVVRLGEDDA